MGGFYNAGKKGGAMNTSTEQTIKIQNGNNLEIYHIEKKGAGMKQRSQIQNGEMGGFYNAGKKGGTMNTSTEQTSTVPPVMETIIDNLDVILNQLKNSIKNKNNIPVRFGKIKANLQQKSKVGSKEWVFSIKNNSIEYKFFKIKLIINEKLKLILDLKSLNIQFFHGGKPLFEGNFQKLLDTFEIKPSENKYITLTLKNRCLRYEKRFRKINFKKLFKNNKHNKVNKNIRSIPAELYNTLIKRGELIYAHNMLKFPVYDMGNLVDALRIKWNINKKNPKYYKYSEIEGLTVLGNKKAHNAFIFEGIFDLLAFIETIHILYKKDYSFILNNNLFICTNGFIDANMNNLKHFLNKDMTIYTVFDADKPGKIYTKKVKQAFKEYEVRNFTWRNLIMKIFSMISSISSKKFTKKNLLKRLLKKIDKELFPKDFFDLFSYWHTYSPLKKTIAYFYLFKLDTMFRMNTTPTFIMS